MDETLKLKTRQRGALKTNVGKELDKIKNTVAPENQTDVDNIKSSLMKLNDYRSRILDLNNDILLSIDNDTNADAEAQSAVDFDDKILDAIASLSTKIDSYKDLISQTNNLLSSTLNHSQVSSSDHKLSIKLPKLEISKYGGDPLEWQEFWDSYSTTVHENDKLSTVDKFKYLRSFLDGDALGHIAGYRITADNYNTVVESLSVRFGNKQIAINAHIDSLLSIPVVTKHDTSQLQKTHDDCERHIRSLIALGLEEEMFGQIFTPIILSKLPVYVKMELHRKLGSTAWSLTNLRELLKEEIRARDMSQRTVGVHSAAEKGHTESQNKQLQQKTKQLGSSASLVANTETRSVRCSFCGESHYTDQCTKYADLQIRKEHVKGRCQICLSSKHSTQSCPFSKNKCFHCRMSGHHRSLCPSQFGQVNNSQIQHNAASNAITEDNTGSNELETRGSSLLSHGEHAILQTALADVRGSQDTSKVSGRLMFDTGSSRTFITTAMADKIAARSNGKDIISLASFAATKRTTASYKNVRFEVVLTDGTTKLVTANVIPTISCPVQKWPIDVKKYPVMKNMKLAEPVVSQPQMVNIDILIGTDYYYDFIGTERIQCSDGLVFLSSSLGFIVTGRVDAQSDVINANINNISILHSSEAIEIMTPGVEKFWSLEDIGIKAPSTTNEDEEALRIFNDTVKFENGRYSVVFPLKPNAGDLPDNKHLAHGRLKSLLKRLDTNPELFKSYDDVIQDQLKKGIIESAPASPTGEIVHYIPHHCVVTPQKTTTKVRIVYDASAKAHKNAPSLNDCMYRGPVLLDDLCGLLLRFRMQAIGLVSDIEKAFLQVGLQESARDLTRFMWVKNPHLPPTGDNLLILRFLRVLFGAISSPFLLGATILHHMKMSNSPASSDVIGSTYVDNVINGKATAEEAISFYIAAKEMFNRASMNLREWFTNSDDVREAIAPNDRGTGDVTKVLGLTWDIKKDTLSCSSFKTVPDAINTKRLMLKYLAKVFDPCGFFSAVTITGKLIIQKLWQQNYAWDDTLPNDIIADWLKISTDLQQIPQDHIPRCINSSSNTETKHELHCCSDASAKAYSAVVYLLTKSSAGTEVNLVFAKSRVAPVKQMSIPRLELMAALIGTRIMNFVEEQLRIEISRKVLWSDSQCILHWLVKPLISTVFVKNRVNEITSHKDINFRYIPTDQNPADLSSRGCSLSTVINSALWWKGPPFLGDEEQEWPKDIPKSLNGSQNVEPEFLHSEIPDTVLTQVEREPLMNCSDFSNINKLFRVTSWVMRFIHNSGNRGVRRTGTISLEEMSASKMYWDKYTQMSAFPGLFVETPSKTDISKVANLNIFVDNNGILRCGGRFQNTDLDDNAKFPKLLPKNDSYTDLVIKDYHCRLLHAPANHTLAQIRYEYWIIHGRGQVTKITRSCRICKFAHGKPYPTPPFPPLPEFRVTKTKPFSRVGVDYFGPLTIKTSSGIQKCWIVLFTCAVIRAVYLDVVDQLSTEQFMLCLRRFTSKHGKPELIVSDNAKQFHAANTTLQKLWCDIEHSHVVQDFAVENGIKWHLITELSPWMGGFYERMVGVVKRSLKKSLDHRCVSLIELQTVISEVAAVVNSRPLIYSEALPSGSTLTPSHFIGGPHLMLPQFNITDVYKEKITTVDSLIIHWKRIQSILDSFWSCWKNEYLLNLRNSASKFKHTSKADSSPTIGAVVLIEDKLPRNQWRMGVVVGLRESADGRVRTATLRMSNQKTIQRPIKLLYPLEIFEKIQDAKINIQPNVKEVVRPKRKAAIVAAQKLQQLTSDDGSSDNSD